MTLSIAKTPHYAPHEPPTATSTTSRQTISAMMGGKVVKETANKAVQAPFRAPRISASSTRQNKTTSGLSCKQSSKQDIEAEIGKQARRSAPFCLVLLTDISGQGNGDHDDAAPKRRAAGP